MCGHEEYDEMQTSLIYRSLFTVGDYCAGGVVGAATAWAVRAVISPQCDMAVAMLLGMAIGMIVHLVLGLFLSPLVGAFHVMVPGSLIGMYGGMLFAMRDVMQHAAGTTGCAILIGWGFGLIVTAAVQIYDRALRGPASSGRGT